MNNVMAIKVTCSGEACIVKGQNTALFDFCEKYIGFPEFIHPQRLPQPFAIAVDEIGLYKDLPVNPIGSWLYQTDIHGHPIVGDLLILKDIMTNDGPDISWLDESDILALSVFLKKLGIENIKEDDRHDEE